MIDYALTTIVRVKDRLQITTTLFDDVLNRMVAAATGRIEQITGRRFASTTHANELYDGSDDYGFAKSTTILKNAPVTSIGGIAYKTGLNSAPIWTTMSQDTYNVALVDGIVYTTMPTGRQNIRMVYTAGYEINWSDTYGTTHTLPYDVTDVCERLVVKMFKKRDSEGRSQESFGESSITWEKGLIDEQEMNIILGYVRNDFV
ncbi:gp6 domain containing protein [uncultured Caudovirales phage]|uniref:Gp6 domain containing protein n=1 Tax=uncultured Caudovirales phage TaxID=2100421 RepID=A0A6J5N2T0_9CAUD|nr:gp6 domain containing protein [uncultured Caudovirales phage]